MAVTRVDRTLSDSPSPCLTIEQESLLGTPSPSAEVKGPLMLRSKCSEQLADRSSVQEKTASESEKRMSDVQTQEDQGRLMRLF